MNDVSEYFEELPDGLSPMQRKATDDVRRLLERTEFARLVPSETSAEVSGRALELRIPHAETDGVDVLVRVEPNGEVGIYCSHLGDDFYYRFNDEYEPHEAAGSYEDALAFIADLLVGKIEASLRIVNGRVSVAEHFRTDSSGAAQSIGRYTHIANVVGGLVSRDKRVERRKIDLR